VVVLGDASDGVKLMYKFFFAVNTSVCYTELLKMFPEFGGIIYINCYTSEILYTRYPTSR
jgi:hypothetical protein